MLDLLVVVVVVIGLISGRGCSSSCLGPLNVTPIEERGCSSSGRGRSSSGLGLSNATPIEERGCSSNSKSNEINKI